MLVYVLPEPSLEQLLVNKVFGTVIKMLLGEPALWHSSLKYPPTQHFIWAYSQLGNLLRYLGRQRRWLVFGPLQPHDRPT